MIAGILQPSSGTIEASGRVSALLELGTGFNPEFTGRDNVFLNASILGLKRPEIEARYPAILDFAEIGDFIGRPVKTYSSGMIMRLAFSVAIHVSPEILLVDEALAVGDIYFRQRCMRKIHEMQRAGVTILYVTHSVADVKTLAQKAIWLAGGRIAEIGDPDRVISRYQAFMVNKDVDYLRPYQHEPETNSGRGCWVTSIPTPHRLRRMRPRRSPRSPTSTIATAPGGRRSWASPHSMDAASDS